MHRLGIIGIYHVDSCYYTNTSEIVRQRFPISTKIWTFGRQWKRNVEGQKHFYWNESSFFVNGSADGRYQS